jgi:hypothetical protein
VAPTEPRTMPKKNARTATKTSAPTLRSGSQQIAEAVADCAGCGREAGPFAAVAAGRKAVLCGECARRLLPGEPKGTVVKAPTSTNKCLMSKMPEAIPPRHNQRGRENGPEK